MIADIPRHARRATPAVRTEAWARRVDVIQRVTHTDALLGNRKMAWRRTHAWSTTDGRPLSAGQQTRAAPPEWPPPAPSIRRPPVRPSSPSCLVSPARRSLVIPIVQQMSSVRARCPFITTAAAATAAAQRTKRGNRHSQQMATLTYFQISYIISSNY